MSYEDAIPILNALKGKGLSVADLDPSFGGGLGFHGVEYFTGPSEVDIRVNNEVNTRVMPIWNTMAVIPGHITDEVVVMGNHRDAWVLGGSDPNAVSK
jgi:N-acetylated-alpha-linked acidic dipeptidase